MNTTWFPLSQLVSYFFMNVIGWAFVNLVNCRPPVEEVPRRDPFTSGNFDHRSFKKFLIGIPIFFLISGIVVFRSRYDLDGYCTDLEKSERIADMQVDSEAEGNSSVTKLESFIDKEGKFDFDLLFMHTIAQTANLHQLQVSLSRSALVCHTYTDKEVFHYNLLWCFGFFILGLNFTHLDVGPLQHFELDWQSMKTWGIFLWCVFLAIVALVIYVACHVFSAYKNSGCLWFYMSYIAATCVFIIWNTKRLKPDGYVIHVHHYCIGFFFMTLLCE